MTIPSIGRIVHYTLSSNDALAINRRRADAISKMGYIMHAASKMGYIMHAAGTGLAREGDVFPMLIVRIWGDTPESYVNGQVFLDGDDVLWAASVSVGVGPRTFAWPTRA